LLPCFQDANNITNFPQSRGDAGSHCWRGPQRFERNRDVLLRYWDAKISTREMLDQIRKPD
jgi:hypothetical protein